MSDILSSIEALIGKKIISITMMEAEIARTVKEYALIVCADEQGNKTRHMYLMAIVEFPHPESDGMLEDAEDGNGFFTIGEMLAIRHGEPIIQADIINQRTMKVIQSARRPAIQPVVKVEDIDDLPKHVIENMNASNVVVGNTHPVGLLGRVLRRLGIIK